MVSFWRLFASSSASNLCDGILQADLPLLAATLTRDPVAISVLAALAFLPWLLFALPAGTLVDRMNRRAAMAGANAFRGVLVGALAAVIGVVTWVVLHSHRHEIAAAFAEESTPSSLTGCGEPSGGSWWRRCSSGWVRGCWSPWSSRCSCRRSDESFVPRTRGGLRV